MSTNKVLKLKTKFGEISDDEMLRWVRERSSNNKSLVLGEQLPRMDRAGATQAKGFSDNDCFIKYIVNKVIAPALLLKSSWSATNANR
jgi:hypothetical protein